MRSRSIRNLMLCVSSVILMSAPMSGCGDSDDGGGGGGQNNENGGGNNQLSNQLANASEAACNKAFDCHEDQLQGSGVEIDRSQICSAYQVAAPTGNLGLQQACVSAVIDFYDCIADSSCAEFESSDGVCRTESDAVTSTCD